MARKAQIVPLVFAGIHPDQKIDPEIRKVFFQVACQNARVEHEQRSVLEQMEKVFQEQGLAYMLLKGASVKRLYPKMGLRTMGDLDVLIKMEQYPKIRTCMLEMGLTEGKETDHELIWYKQPCVQIELHKRLIPSYNEDYHDYFGNGWKRAEAMEAGCRYEMRPEDELIYILTHFAKHYRDGGIGIRHMVDFWVFHRTHPHLEEAYLHEELDKLRLRQFYENVMLTIAVWFENAEETAVTAQITNWVFGSGTYGQLEGHNAANALRATKRHKNVQSAKREGIRNAIFLPYAFMRQRYPVLNKCPLLLPVMWVVRWCDAIFCRRNRIRWHKERLDAMSRETVEKYQEELALVGLAFHIGQKSR